MREGSGFGCPVASPRVSSLVESRPRVAPAVNREPTFPRRPPLLWHERSGDPGSSVREDVKIDQMDYQDAVDALYARMPTRMGPSLDRIIRLAELLDHPERTAPAVHLTGTNGKTTTARMVAALLAAFGVGAGVYTSPHLQDVRERVA